MAFTGVYRGKDAIALPGGFQPPGSGTPGPRRTMDVRRLLWRTASLAAAVLGVSACCAERMKVITQQVERSADEQNRGGQQVTQSIENIREMAERIAQSSREHKDTNRHLSSAVAEAAAAGERCLATSNKLARILGDSTEHLDGILSSSSGA